MWYFSIINASSDILVLNLMTWCLQTAKVRDEHPEDISVSRAISVVLDRHPELRYLIEKRILWAKQALRL